MVHGLAARNRGAIARGIVEAADLIVAYSGLLTPYPWPDHVLLEGPESGMEYPMLTMSDGTRLAHEIARQWFPMLVGSDESRFNFLDEGMASFLSSISGGVASTTSQYAQRIPLIDPDDIRSIRPTIGYGRGARMMNHLVSRFGVEPVLSALRDYVVEWSYRHPTPWHFMNSMENSLRTDLDHVWLGWLFNSGAIP